MPPVSARWMASWPAVSTVASMVPSCTASAISAASGRSSRTTISRPLLRKAISRMRVVMVSREYVVVSKMSLEAQ